MKLDLLSLLVCPQCGEHPLRCESFGGDEGGQIVNGVVWCSCCASWYPVEGELLELLPDALAYAADRARFWSVYQRQLRALNLQPPAADEAGTEMRQQRHQQEHSDWYADNPQQTYSTYERL